MEALRKTYLALGEHVSTFAELERRCNGLEYEIARLTEENRLLVEYIEAEFAELERRCNVLEYEIAIAD